MATAAERKLIADLVTQVGELTSETRVSNQKWDEQARLNKVVLRKLDEHGRALHGSNGDEGLVGEGKTRDGRIKVLEKFQDGHEDDVKWAFRSAVGSFLMLLGGAITAAFSWISSWK